MTSAGNEGHSFLAGPVAASVRSPMSPPSRRCRRYNPLASPEYQEGEPCRGRPQVFHIKSVLSWLSFFWGMEASGFVSSEYQALATTESSSSALTGTA